MQRVQSRRLVRARVVLAAVVCLLLGLVLLAASVRAVSAQGQDNPEIGPLPYPELSGAWLMGATAVFLSVLIEYVPTFSEFWDAYAYKREVLAGAGLVLACALVGGHYAGAFDLALGPFGWHVIGAVIQAWLEFAGAGQLAWTSMRALGVVPRKREDAS